MKRQGRGAFAPILRDVERGLAIPIPGKVKILRELHADLEELQDRLVDEGLSPDEARGRALEALVPDLESLAALGSLHTPLYRRLTRRFSSRNVRIAERAALAMAAGLVLAVQAFSLLRVDLMRNPSPLLVPVLIGGTGLFALILWKVFQLWIKGDHDRVERGLATILGVSGGLLILGPMGMILDLYRLAIHLERVPERAVGLVSDWLVANSALVAVSTILAMAGGLAWFVFSHWLALVSGAREEILELGPRA